jgi:hypothetical protein
VEDGLGRVREGDLHSMHEGVRLGGPRASAGGGGPERGGDLVGDGAWHPGPGQRAGDVGVVLADQVIPLKFIFRWILILEIYIETLSKKWLSIQKSMK